MYSYDLYRSRQKFMIPMSTISTFCEIKKSTVKALSAASILQDQPERNRITSAQFRHARHIEVIINHLLTGYVKYEDLVSYIYRDSSDRISTGYVANRMHELCKLFGYNNNTNWTFEKWDLLMGQIRRFQRNEADKWTGVFKPNNGSYVYIDNSESSSNYFTQEANEVHVHSFTSNVIPINSVSQLKLVNSDNLIIKVDYLLYLIEKIKIKFGPNYIPHLMFAFCKVTSATPEMFSLSDDELVSELKDYYSNFDEQNELLLISSLLSKLTN